jgi:hypothetical protein
VPERERERERESQGCLCLFPSSSASSSPPSPARTRMLAHVPRRSVTRFKAEDEAIEGLGREGGAKKTGRTDGRTDGQTNGEKTEICFPYMAVVL